MSALALTVEVHVPGYADALAASMARRRQWPEGEDAVPARRRKLWEVSTAHHCAVIGTCLTVAELRRLARQAGMDDWEAATDYALHHSAVHHARDRNALSALMHKALERKFAASVRRCAAMNHDDEIRRSWREAVARGDVAGVLWAVVTHPATSDATLDQVSGELHMLSHQTGAASRADLQRLAALEDEKCGLQAQLRRQQVRMTAELEQKNAAIAALEQRAAQGAIAERRLREAQARIRALEDEGELSQLRSRLAMETLRAERAEERAASLAELAARCAGLETQLSDSRLECEALERALHQALAGAPCGAARAGECAADLSGRSVLYVGGRAGLVDHYRVLVEQCHGRFVYHDGGQEDGAKRLQPLLASADCVVCATGNVSHAAYYLVKRYCKQDGKPCVLLRNASLASFARGIRALANGAPAQAVDTVLVADRSHAARQAGSSTGGR